MKWLKVPIWFADREMHPPEVAGAVTNSNSSEKWGLGERNVQLFYCLILSFMCFVSYGKDWFPVSTYETQSVNVVKLWLGTVWRVHWVTLDLKHSGCMTDVGVVPELVPGSPRELSLKEEYMNLMTSVER